MSHASLTLSRKLLDVAEDPEHLWHIVNHDVHVGSDMLALVTLHQIPQLDKITDPLFGL